MDQSMKVKKIVILNGSPKKAMSSTMQVTNAFVEGISRQCKTEIVTVHIADLSMKPCIGCLSCWGRTEGECIIKDDDIHRIKEIIESSDIVIESYPLYFFGMPGIMKVFTDRMLGMMCTYRGQRAPEQDESFHGIRNPRENQQFVLISSCAYTEADAVFESLLKQYDCICGKNKYTAILCPQLKTLIDLKNKDKIDHHLQKFSQAGEEFALTGSLSEKTKALLKKPPFSVGAYKIFLNNFWTQEKENK